MKRKVMIIAAVAGLVAVGASLGPELWSGYRFLTAVERRAADESAKVGPWPRLQATCAHCHGPEGRADNGLYPSLAGLSALYLEKQLRAFASGERNHAQMSPLAAGLTPEQITDLADYYERQRAAERALTDRSPAPTRQGQKIVTDRACSACHGEKLQGGVPGPRLAGQGQGYLEDQLMAYKKGTRRDPTGAMNTMVGTLSEQDIRLVAAYLAGLGTASR